MTSTVSRGKILPRVDKKKGSKTQDIKQADPWKDWAPQWRGDVATTAGVHDLQERHAPTIAMAHPDGPARQSIRRRIVDARLWDAMTSPQQRAALQIVAAYEAMSRGLGRVTSDWARVPGSGGASALSDGQSRFLDLYMDWVTACQKKKISHAMIVDVLVFGKSFRTVDRERRQRAGSARRNMMDGLDTYAVQQGWR